MAFVKEHAQLNEWLSHSSSTFSLLKNSDYKKMMKRWKYAFEYRSRFHKEVHSGEKAMRAIEEQLPANAFVFNLPGNPYLPASVGSTTRAYAYHVEGLTKVDEGVAFSVYGRPQFHEPNTPSSRPSK